MTKQALRICQVGSEFAPLAKIGGLADVIAGLSAYLHRAGHDVRVLVPRYPTIERAGFVTEPVDGLSDLAIGTGRGAVRVSIDRGTLPESGLSIYLLRCPELFGRENIYTQDDDEHLRFVVLSKASIEMCQRTGFAPHIYHCHDWQTALIPLYLRSVYASDQLFSDTRSVLTIHNIGYQGVFPASALEQLQLMGAEHYLHQDDLKEGVINFLKTGIRYADVVTTVSPTYAREILGEEYGMGLNDLLRTRAGTVVGILNGVDYAEWDPATDTLIPARYTASDLSGKTACKKRLMAEMGLEVKADRPLFGIVSRLVGQKGIDLIGEIVPRLLTRRDFALAALGSGEHRYESLFTGMQDRFRGRVAYYQGYSNELAHWIEAGSDMFLMPSLYEPCGLNQMYSLRYGTVPIVRETGGLADSVEQIDPGRGSGTGILFRDYSVMGLEWALEQALALYADKPLLQQVIANGMAKDFSWEQQGARYVELFRELTNPP